MAEQMIGATEITIGAVFAGHRIDGVLGRGGMGVVYRATDLRLGRPVAMKVISPTYSADEDFRRRFRRESQMAASISQANAVTVFQAGEAGGLLYVTMQLVEGTDLRQVLTERGRLDVETSCNVLAQVAAALDAAHARGLVHRDVKPANILIANETPMRVFLTDFGLTKRASSQSGLTKTGLFVGTIDYASPEQIKGWPVDARSDVYALGCVLFQMLTGQPPFRRENEYATMYAHTSEPAPDPRSVAPDIPPGLAAVTLRALQKDPDQRFPSAGDFARAAAAGAAGRVASMPERSVAVGGAAPPQPETALETPPPTPTPAPHPVYGYGIDPNASQPTTPLPRRRSPWPAVIVLVGLLLVGGGVGAALLVGGKKSSHHTVTTGRRANPGGSSGASNQAAVRRGTTQIADVLTLAEKGRTDTANGDFSAAIANRQQVLDRLDALSLPPQLITSQRLLRQAMQASLAADRVHDSCGPGCGLLPVDRRASALKVRFVNEFNPFAERFLGRSYDPNGI